MEAESSNDVASQDSSLPKEIWWSNEYLYQWQGFWFRLPYLQGTQEAVKSFNPLPTDVILTSFPKTGTTWLKALLFSIINRSSKELLVSNSPHELVPVLELKLYGPNALPSGDDLRVPYGTNTRIFHTHIAYRILAHKFLSSNCRIVYVTRNPKDTLISLWHFAQKGKKFENHVPIEVAVDKFCSGVVPFGPYYQHVLEYWKESLSRPGNVFFITYEELILDPKHHMKRLASFLGCPFDVDHENEVVEEIVRECSFECLSKHEANKSSNIPTWFELPYHSFFRQGGVGDHKNYLSDELIKRIDETTVEKFHKSGLMFGI